MHMHWDADEWEAVSDYRPCTVCRGDMSKCNGACNGSSFIGHRRRAPEEVARIKAERLRREEDEILARAEVIRRQRGIPEAGCMAGMVEGRRG